MLEEIIGYCLYPDYDIAAMFFLLGKGEIGKTTYLRLIERFLTKENVVV